MIFIFLPLLFTLASAGTVTVLGWSVEIDSTVVVVIAGAGVMAGAGTMAGAGVAGTVVCWVVVVVVWALAE